MNNLSGKVAIVTGSSRGIGSIIAQDLAKAGCSLIVNYSGSEAAAKAVVDQITSAGGQAIAVRANVASPSDMTALFDAAITQYGKVDILVNNAGINIYKLVKDTTEEDFDRIFQINVKGVFLGLKEAATRLEANGRAINFSSSVTRLMLPTYGVYSATKAAVEQLTRVFAKEVGARGITVNSISPGPTNTDLFLEGKSEETIQRLAAMSALGRIGEPVDISRVVLFLASESASWVTGQNLGVNGGFA
ncbi:MAG: SDR family oxidoreductase [Microcoleus sp. PH2017_01_SCD_O_A]|jgi:3-oxoacyl-[acyl-carrier protein] reductase|uniref:SDR family oxidoreductase n=1 Tax=unclassified Microcoleus TaxID=2642155 RepID=UPI001DCCAD90|nr:MULTISPECIES: SDR family oxidoreductase [unclassified Microcoleus]MCC3429425.1 SDR family oxidoreductase [Microcoleus sp. PH2017_04_SCI_O_A]MCC3441726.1 SDR family oxidoreductase [Microcoleus sp. PH2017_03_ELD_O_A]MCC3467287.1 SDR family oxidoreductase [Microcoleus sp. PH2017_06_SFM_O_A]MCC3511633.1 SDR family oxidoreductase [Microcoleus sp. PH2017_17_BER_D_A]TAE07755.1 MAG: SDR family oxidoreductase [Oscillatoriales cyanobacterium]